MLRILASALIASLLAGATGLFAVFGHGLLDAPGVALVGFMYSIIPGLLGLLGVHALLRRSRAGTGRDLANYTLLSALIALLWLVPFVGLFVPTDGPNGPAAIAGLAVYHAVSGAIGGLVFWLLTRKAGIS